MLISIDGDSRKKPAPTATRWWLGLGQHHDPQTISADGRALCVFIVLRTPLQCISQLKIRRAAIIAESTNQ